MSTPVYLRFGFRVGPAGLDRDASLPAELVAAAAEFPTVVFAAVEGDERAARDAVTVDAGAWCRGEVDLHRLDFQVDELADQGLVTVRVAGEGASRVTPEVLTRCQRWVGRRNAHARTPVFDRILALHRELHDLQKPLVRADYDHALDVWQWLLRLCPEAGTAVQIAALFHDIERLISEADARIEHRAAGTGGTVSYDAFKHAHARAGARLTHTLLSTLGVVEDLRRRVAHLVERHESRPDPDTHDPDLALLNDADGLSFFSLNSAGFLDYYGPVHTRRKIAWTLNRLSARALVRLPRVRLRPDVARLVHEVTARQPCQPSQAPCTGEEEEP